MRRLVSMFVVAAMAIGVATAGSVKPDKKFKMRIAVAPLNWGDGNWDG